MRSSRCRLSRSSIEHHPFRLCPLADLRTQHRRVDHVDVALEHVLELTAKGCLALERSVNAGPTTHQDVDIRAGPEVGVDRCPEDAQLAEPEASRDPSEGAA